MKATTGTDVIFFELLERALRVYYHVRKSITYASHPLRRQTAQKVIADHVLNVVRQSVVEAITTFHRSTLTTDHKKEALLIQFHDLATLHERLLITVPRPGEPIELVSYLRQAQRGVKGNGEKVSGHRLLVYATEALGDQAHARFHSPRPARFADGIGLPTLSELLTFTRDALSDSVSGEPPAAKNGMPPGYISLPRLDLGNPLRWPSLLHEVAHFEVDRGVLWEKFCASISTKTLKTLREEITKFGNSPINLPLVSSKDLDRGIRKESAVNDSNADIELADWLVECWCDAKATQMSGAATLFAQAQAFSFSVPCYLSQQPRWKRYPPAWFRLRIIRSLITARNSVSAASANYDVNPQIDEMWSRLQSVFPDQCSFTQHPELHTIFLLFRVFLTQQFPPVSWTHHGEIAPENFHRLVSDLEAGFPIPAVGQSDRQAERAASHAEILVAGWTHRQGDYRGALLATAEEYFQGGLLDGEEEKIASVIEKLANLVERSDVVLQTSIQCSEWFSILRTFGDPSALNSAKEAKGHIQSIGGADLGVAGVAAELANAESSRSQPEHAENALLVDSQILAMLESRELRVIPGLSPQTDVSGSVIDLRLGHNFEVFYPNVRGAYDPMSYPHKEIASMEIDIDSLEGLELMPGQFVLAHTLEFLSLPERVAAQIEGRSSFARLGLQVHMTANLVEAGFEGCLTLEIANQGHSAVKLYPGLRIAQLRLFGLKQAPIHTYKNRRDSKFRGMLRHGRTRQFGDWESDSLRAESELRKLIG